MGKSRNLYLRAEFREAEAVKEAIAPHLAIRVHLTLSGGGAGHSFTVPDYVSEILIDHAEAYFYWHSGDQAFGNNSFIGRGSLDDTSYLGSVHVTGNPIECVFWVPLPLVTLSRIENLRKGQKARFWMTLRVLGHYNLIIGAFEPHGSNKTSTPVTRGELEQARIQESINVPFTVQSLPLTEGRSGTAKNIEIEKSKWAEDILPALGYGSWRVYEIPLTEVSRVSEIDDELDAAVKQFNDGDWRGSLSKSRVVVEAIRPYVQKYANPVYTDDKGGSTEKKLDEFTTSFSELAEKMMSFQSKVFKILSAGSHKLPEGATIERPDAEFGLTVAMACRRYVGVRMLEPLS